MSCSAPCGAPAPKASIVRAEPPRAARTLMLTDLLWALAARRAAVSELRRIEARALIYSSTTAALLVAETGRDPLRRTGRRQPSRAPWPMAAATRAHTSARSAFALALE